MEDKSELVSRESDPRLLIEKEYHDVLAQRGLLVEALDDQTKQHILDTTKRFREYIGDKDPNISDQAEIYQSTRVYVLYLAQIYNLLQALPAHNQDARRLRESFASFGNFARVSTGFKLEATRAY